MLGNLEISGASIVLIGSFNPPIFQPEWFANQDLLPKTEVESASIQIIGPQVAQFETERFVFQVTFDRLLAITKPNALPEALRDLIAGTFYLLEHTPVQAMGLNRQLHFSMGSEETWHRVGDRLAPKDLWKTLSDRRPGMKDLQILYDSDGPDKPAMTITVQPSLLVKNGVYFEINNHFAPGKQGTENLKMLMNILKERWEEIQRNAERIANAVLDWTAA